MRAVGGTRSRMTASPRSYDLLLHRLVNRMGGSRWVPGEGQNPRATARLQFFSRERESVNRLTGMIGHFHLPAAARFDPTVHLPDDFAA